MNCKINKHGYLKAGQVSSALYVNIWKANYVKTFKPDRKKEKFEFGADWKAFEFRKEFSMSSYIDRIRKHVGHDKILLIFASACIRDTTGRLLWQRRADFGWWGLPGGILELGESLSECIVREVREETGLEVEPSRLIGIYSSPEFDVTYPNGDQVQQVTACFDCHIVGGELRPDENETLDLAWFPMDEMPYTAPWYIAMIKDLALGQKVAAFD